MATRTSPTTDRKTLISMLGAVPLFERLSKKDLDLIAKSSSEVDHRAGQHVVEEGRTGVGFHLILSGTATVKRGGRRLRSLGPGESFGDIALIDGGPRSATVIADTPLRTLALATWNFRPLLTEHPEVAYKLLIQLCARLRDAEKRLPI